MARHPYMASLTPVFCGLARPPRFSLVTQAKFMLTTRSICIYSIVSTELGARRLHIALKTGLMTIHSTCLLP